MNYRYLVKAFFLWSYRCVFLCCCFSFTAFSQQLSISINDNLGSQYVSSAYFITNDSLVITGVSDKGNTHVNYLNRKLTPEEITSLQSFIKSFPIDSLKDVFFNDYSNFEYISAENFPRMIELEINNGKTTVKSKATNAYVESFARLFNELNKMIPAEVQIKYDRNKFNAFY